MRGSLDRAKNKAAEKNLEKAQTKKARKDLNSSHSQAPPNHGNGNQQGDTEMEGIFLPNMPRFRAVPWDRTQAITASEALKPSSTFGPYTWSRPYLQAIVVSFDKAKRLKLKPIRGSLDTAQSEAKLKARVQEGSTSLDAITLPNMLRGSLDKAKSNSTKGEFERLKLKPIRGSLNKNESQENGEKSNTNMDDIALPDMLRFLEKEEALLTHMQSKMADELSRLQVEEHVFLHTLKILSQKHASINKVNENQQQTSSGDQDLIDALNEALMENGESVPINEDKSEETSEE